MVKLSANTEVVNTYDDPSETIKYNERDLRLCDYSNVWCSFNRLTSLFENSLYDLVVDDNLFDLNRGEEPSLQLGTCCSVI